MTYTTPTELANAIGLEHTAAGRKRIRASRREAVRLALLAAGLDDAQPPGGTARDGDLHQGIVSAFRSKARLLSHVRCPVDARIEAYLNRYLSDLQLDFTPGVPPAGVVLLRHGIARELSVPRPPGNRFESPLLKSYRVRNGVLHNPKATSRRVGCRYRWTRCRCRSGCSRSCCGTR